MGSEKDKIEEITKIVLQVLNAQKESHTERKTSLSKVFQNLLGNRVLLSLFIGLITAIIGLIYFEISPFYKLEEIADSQKNMEYNKKMVQRHLELGNSFLSTSQVDAAKIEFEKALELDKYNTEAHFGKLKSEIFIPIANRDFDSEITEKRLRLALLEKPNDPHIFSFLGDVYSRNDIARDSAMYYYRKAINIDSTIAPAYQGMAIIYELMGENENALKMQLKAHSLSKWNQTYLSNLAYQYSQIANYEKAIEYFLMAVSLNGDYTYAHLELSNVYRLKGNLWYSFQYSEFLIERLNNAEIMNQKMNQGEWFYQTDSGTVYLNTLSLKKCYAYYGIALTAYLRYDFTIAGEYVNKAKELNSKKEYLVKLVLKKDINTLRDSQASYSSQLDSFMAKYNI